jgi:MFS family permease
MQHSLSSRNPWKSFAGLRVFLLVWIGQLVSVFGSGLTSFSLGLWVYQRTGSVTAYSLMALAHALPQVLFSPLAGIAADRYDRRKLMIFSDLGASLSTLAIALLMWSGHLEIWQLYALTFIGAASSAFQWPAYSAAVPQLVTEEQLGRVNGLISIGRAAAEMLAPTLAGLLVVSIGIPGVMLIDFATFLFAVSMILRIQFPALPVQQEPANAHTFSLWKDALFGWRYVLAQPGLFALLLFIMLFNFIWGMVSALAAPLILNFSSAQGLGLFVTIAGTGMLTGSLVMSAWGGPKRRIIGVVGFELLSGFFFILMGLRPILWLVALGAFGAHFTIAIIDGSNKSIWQKIVPPEIQGRVFAVWQMVAMAATPLAYITAGPLADQVFEPLMRSGLSNTAWLTALVTSGPGRGIGLMFVLMGILKILAASACALSRNVRNLEAGRS